LEFAEFAVAILDIVANLDRRRILERTGYRADQGRRHRFGCKPNLLRTDSAKPANAFRLAGHNASSLAATVPVRRRFRHSLSDFRSCVEERRAMMQPAE